MFFNFPSFPSLIVHHIEFFQKKKLVKISFPLFALAFLSKNYRFFFEIHFNVQNEPKTVFKNDEKKFFNETETLP